MEIQQTHLYKEIFEQPEVIQRLLDHETANVNELAQIIRERNISYINIAARGTSDNAGRYAQYVFGAHNRLPVALATPSLYTLYKRPPLLGNSLVLGISQSGKSPDIVAVLAEARQQGALTVAITNSPDSELAHQAEYVIPLHAGEEQAVAATKTYTAALAAIALLSSTLAADKQMLNDLRIIPKAIEKTLGVLPNIVEHAPRYRYMEKCVVIGRGFNYATAFETALKLKELTYVLAEPYSSADFLHGPLAMLEQGFPVFVFANQGPLLPEIQILIQTLSKLGAEVVSISDDKSILEMVNIPISLDASIPEWLSPFTAIIPGQLLAMYLAHERNYNVDQPRIIQKVTKTK
ncbi:MAG: SIS domain-containing protein [Chloroflexi bacterium]|nr:SIS domain-containing protein [Chloroflexota bacterium]NOH14022.1 SIS domain-containing protein [Chloroflexota bacterium]